MSIKQFEDIEAWKEARKLTRMVYEFTGKTPFKRDFGLSDQIQRAAVSVMSNIAEGFDSGSKAEFMRFLKYSRRSTSEVQCHSYAALDQRYINENQFTEIYDQAEKARKLISAFLRYLSGPSSSHRSNRLTGQLANRITDK